MSKLERDVDELEGRALDRAVAEEVYGGRLEESRPWEVWDEPPKVRLVLRLDGEMLWSHSGDWSPSTSIEAAWEVAEQFDTYEVGRVYDTGNTFSDADGFHFRASVTRFSDEAWGRALAETAPLAICRAALKAVRQQGGPGG